MNIDPQDWCRVWYEIGKLQAITEELQREVRLLKGNGRTIDHEPEPAPRETKGNVICLPGVALHNPRKGRKADRKPPRKR